MVAAIVPVNQNEPDVQALFALCGEKLEPNFGPTYFQVVSEIPKTASEKPIERFLLEDFNAARANIINQEEALRFKSASSITSK